MVGIIERGNHQMYLVNTFGKLMFNSIKNYFSNDNKVSVHNKQKQHDLILVVSRWAVLSSKQNCVKNGLLSYKSPWPIQPLNGQ